MVIPADAFVIAVIALAVAWVLVTLIRRSR